MYFALNGALHDAAVVAWGIERELPVRAPDLDDPEPGLRRPVERSACAFVQPRRPPPRPRPRRADHAVIGIQRTAPRGSLEAHRRRRHPNHARLGPGSRWTSPGRTPSFPGWVSDESVFDRAATEILVAEGGSRLLPPGTVLSRWVSYRRAADAAGRSQVYAGTQNPGRRPHRPQHRFRGRQASVVARPALRRGHRGRLETQRPAFTCSRRAIVSSVTARSRITPVTM